jgi:8-oxo-dGTP pyrophosphatase MutT (NUDIX family)
MCEKTSYGLLWGYNSFLMSRETYSQPPLFDIEANVAAVFLVKNIGAIPHILMGRRADEAARYRATPPGGKKEIGETIEKCAMREVREETGRELSEVCLIPAGPIMYVGEYRIKPFFDFVEDDWEPNNLEPEKNLYWSWLSVLDLFQYVDVGMYPDVVNTKNFWIAALAEQQVIDGLPASTVIPTNMLPTYDLFADIIESDCVGED